VADLRVEICRNLIQKLNDITFLKLCSELTCFKLRYIQCAVNEVVELDCVGINVCSDLLGGFVFLLHESLNLLSHCHNWVQGCLKLMSHGREENVHQSCFSGLKLLDSSYIIDKNNFLVFILWMLDLDQNVLLFVQLFKDEVLPLLGKMFDTLMLDQELPEWEVLCRLVIWVLRSGAYLTIKISKPLYIHIMNARLSIYRLRCIFSIILQGFILFVAFFVKEEKLLDFSLDHWRRWIIWVTFDTKYLVKWLVNEEDFSLDEFLSLMINLASL